MRVHSYLFFLGIGHIDLRILCFQMHKWVGLGIVTKELTWQIMRKRHVSGVALF